MKAIVVELRDELRNVTMAYDDQAGELKKLEQSASDSSTAEQLSASGELSQTANLILATALNQGCQLEEIQILNLAGEKDIDNSGLSELSGMLKLTALNLAGTSVTGGSGLSNLCSATTHSLKALQLDHCDITCLGEKSMLPLLALRSLVVLTLEGCNLEDPGDGIIHLLGELPELLQLSLRGTKVAIKALQDLVCAQPQTFGPLRVKGKLEKMVMPSERAWHEHLENRRYWAGADAQILSDPALIPHSSRDEILSQLADYHLQNNVADQDVRDLKSCLNSILKQRFADHTLMSVSAALLPTRAELGW